MRAIKFRQWKKDAFHYYGFTQDGRFLGPISPLEDALKNTEQFTGLFDKNGKDIFEGDILCSKADKKSDGGWIAGTYGFHPENSVVVGFSHGKFTYGPVKDLWDELVFQRNWGGLEVIGNIHENPELLEAKP